MRLTGTVRAASIDAALLIVDLAYPAPATSGIGYLLVLTGIPVYLVWRRRGANVRQNSALETAARNQIERG